MWEFNKLIYSWHVVYAQVLAIIEKLFIYFTCVWVERNLSVKCKGQQNRVL